MKIELDINFITKESWKKNECLPLTACKTSLLVFVKLFALFYYFRFVLVEKSQLPSRNEFCKPNVIGQHNKKGFIEINFVGIIDLKANFKYPYINNTIC